VKGNSATPPAPGDVRQLQANDVLVEATPVQSGKERSVITATIHNTSDGLLTSEPVVFYDGDPENGGKVIDFQRIPYLEKDSTYALRTYLKPEASGTHNIFVRVGRKDARPSSLAIGSLIVP